MIWTSDLQSVYAVHSTILGRNLQRVVSLAVRLFCPPALHGVRSPTMGGLYFWVCKMKPDTPMLGCELYID